MYRQAEYRLFSILSWFAIILASAALIAVAVHCLTPLKVWKNLAVLLLVFSFFFQIQIFMYKFTVIERRMLYLVGLSEQHFRIAEKRANVQLVFYFILFWIALLGVALLSIPKP